MKIYTPLGEAKLEVEGDNALAIKEYIEDKVYGYSKKEEEMIEVIYADLQKEMSRMRARIRDYEKGKRQGGG